MLTLDVHRLIHQFPNITLHYTTFSFLIPQISEDDICWGTNSEQNFALSFPVEHVKQILEALSASFFV